MDLFQLLSTQNDVVIIQCNDTKQTWQQLKEQVAGVQQQLLLSKAKNCVIFSNNTTEFIVSFLACSYLGVDIFLPPNNTRQMIESLNADVFIGNFEVSLQVKSSTKDIVNNSIDPNVTIFTSGSTGQPKKISRKLTQLFKETDEINQIWGNDTGSVLFASTVSYQHIYGLLFSIIWPLRNRHIIWNKIIPFEESLQKIITDFKKIVLISSPAFLKRISDHPIEISEEMQVFCSGGVLTNSQHEIASSILKSNITQVYGSTETGGIAHKLLGRNWQFFPSVQHKIEKGILLVQSPFCYQQRWQNTNDIIAVVGDGFELLGRSDRIVKIEEKRVSLIQVEESISQHDLVKEAHVISINNSRQYIAAIIVLNTKGNETRKQYSDKHIKKIIKSFLRDKVERLAIPRQIKFLDELPTNTQGKILHHQVESLFK